MDKGDQEKGKYADTSYVKERSSGYPTLALSITTLFLATALLVTCIGGVMYLSKISRYTQNTKYTSGENKIEQRITPKEFMVGVPRHQSDTPVELIEYQYVSIDEQQDIEYIFFKDPEWLHIQDVVYIDHKNGLQILYGSETASCYFARDDVSSLDENIQSLVQHNGQNVSRPIFYADHRVGEMVSTMEDIPIAMTPFCSLSNSYWFETGQYFREDSERYHVCICSYAFCWCTYCVDPNCWGRCCNAWERPGTVLV